MLLDDDVFRSAAERRETGSGGGGTWKKRFSVFRKDANEENDEEGGEATLLLGQEEESRGLREGGETSTADAWFDIAMNFCSEMDLPVRDDVDEEIVKEAQNMMREEGR